MAPRLAGQLDQADGDGHRRILDGREKFRRQRRHDDANRHRQQHVSVGLRGRQSERGPRPIFVHRGSELMPARVCSATRADMNNPIPIAAV